MEFSPHFDLLRTDSRPPRQSAQKRRNTSPGPFRKGLLQAAINEANHHLKPFVWTTDPDKIIAAVKRGHQALDPIH